MQIRFMQPNDQRQLRSLILKYLKETFEKGGDFPPTLENAQAFFAFGLQGVQLGDPCLVAVHDTDVVLTREGDKEPRLMGFIGTQGIHFPGMQTRDQSIRSWGTYVLPEYREHNVAVKLFMVMGRIAKNKGYTRIMSSTHGTGYSERAMRVVKKVAGIREIGTLLMWQLSAPIVGASDVESHNMPGSVLATEAGE